MPRGDGTGPAGMGPMTGRGAGVCAGVAAPGFANAWGRGGAWRRGRGMAWGRPWPAPPVMAPVSERDALQSQAQALENALEQVKKQLAALASKDVEDR